MHPVQSVPAETLLFEAATLRVLDASPALCIKLGRNLAQLRDLCFDVLQAEPAALAAGYTVTTVLLRHDGSRYPVRAHLLAQERGRMLAVFDDLVKEHEAATARDLYRSRFDAIVSHTPGLVYQFVLHADGSVAFPYLSEGCAALLGKSAQQLQRKADAMLLMILPDDRRSYLDAMHLSAKLLTPWNWEGRIWIDAWKDIKWINLRATPRALAAPSGSVQWEGIMSNITDSRREQIDAAASRASLAELAAHSEQVKEQERTRIAREVHDELGGNLSAIKMALAMVARRLPDDAVLVDKTQYVDTLVDRTIDAVHRIAAGLRPALLDLGIHAALEWQLQEFARQTGIVCNLLANDKDIGLVEDHATAMFRIFQEALTNIAKHAGATRVMVRLQRLRHHICLKISDNGAGIGPNDRNKPQSFGLRGMQERAEALGGTLIVANAPGGGTTVTIKIRLSSPSP
jgi:two-component system sensor histidine kinase UhpB